MLPQGDYSMAARKFKFVSPGIFLKEVDQSQLPRLPGNIGPVIIGRTRKGPALRPTLVNSYEEFVEVFGTPVPGNQGDDTWRDGNGLLAPAYAHYAAKAYFAGGNESPVTVVRLLGVKGDHAGDGGESGWKAKRSFGLFVYPDGSIAGQTLQLAAIIYTTDDNVTVKLKGLKDDGTPTAAAGEDHKAVKDDENNSGRFKLAIADSSNTRTVDIDFTKGSKFFIRDVLNTNPVMTNSFVATANAKTVEGKYWLGETFESTVPTGNLRGIIHELADETANNMNEFEFDANAGKTGWVISQDEGDAENFDILNLDKLFRAIALSEGEDFSRNYAVAIEDIRLPSTGDVDPYGSFTLAVKKQYGSRWETIESFTGCTLNPNSQNYVARQVGDQYFQWSAIEKRNKVYGNYPNRSKYIRLEMHSKVDSGLVSPSKMPFGYLGPIIPADISVTLSGGSKAVTSTSFVDNSGTDISVATGSDSAATFTLAYPKLPLAESVDPNGGDYFGAALYKKNGTALTSTPDDATVDYLRKAATGFTGDQDKGTATAGTTQHAFLFSLDDVIVTGTDLGSAGTANVITATWTSGSRNSPRAKAIIEVTDAGGIAHGETFTLVDSAGLSTVYTVNGGVAAVSGGGSGGTAIVGLQGVGGGAAGKIAAATAIAEAINRTTDANYTAVSDGVSKVTVTQGTAVAAGNKDNTDAIGGVTVPNFTGANNQSLTATSGSQSILDLGFNKFWMPLAGGFDGVDITEADPFNNTRALNGGATDKYAYASVDRAIDLVKDPEALEFNLAAMPGITNTGLTTKLVEACESRADALAIIDLPSVYLPAHELKCDNQTDGQKRIGTDPTKAARDLKERAMNSSYGAAYYPWVKISDTENTRELWAPPSVVALGVMAYTERRDEVWFAPAGFNRGGLNEGNAGIPVLQVSEQLLSKQRDTLYEANINPIASFVTEGLVIFGQKTLQSTPSALDRINVRRLLIFVKKEVSRIASGLLFDQNVPATWNRFLGQVNPFLQSVKTRLGLSDFKVILDNTTTTPDLVDRNVMYAKIFLKPARSIEFIAVDFVITNTGASFDD